MTGRSGPLMGEAAAAGADVVVVTSDNPRSEDPAAIIEAVLAGHRPTTPHLTVEPDRRRRHRRWPSPRPRPATSCVIAGKGHETTQIIGDRVVPFDDRRSCARSWAARGHGAAPDA